MSRLALEAKAAAQHAEDARSCKVCMDREIDTVFIPCGHLCTCAVCYEINAPTAALSAAAGSSAPGPRHKVSSTRYLGSSHGPRKTPGGRGRLLTQ